jgi:hypothetical protein
MRRIGITVILALAVSPVLATVVLNEVFVNPPTSSFDDTREFIELLGTPGMRLDGYAVAVVSGGLTKYYILNST